MMPSKRKELRKGGELGAIYERLEKLKASVRAKVEHPFQVIKCQWHYRKTRYKGLFKNTMQIVTLFALSNLWRVRRTLLSQSLRARG
jgi:IS5 family transposase